MHTLILLLLLWASPWITHGDGQGIYPNTVTWPDSVLVYYGPPDVAAHEIIYCDGSVDEDQYHPVNADHGMTFVGGTWIKSIRVWAEVGTDYMQITSRELTCPQAYFPIAGFREKP
jgi:hypothetical protein